MEKHKVRGHPGQSMEDTRAQARALSNFHRQETIVQDKLAKTKNKQSEKKKQGEYNFTKAKGEIFQDGGSGELWWMQLRCDRESTSELLKSFEVNGTAKTQKPDWRGEENK